MEAITEIKLHQCETQNNLEVKNLRDMWVGFISATLTIFEVFLMTFCD